MRFSPKTVFEDSIQSEIPELICAGYAFNLNSAVEDEISTAAQLEVCFVFYYKSDDCVSRRMGKWPSFQDQNLSPHG